MKCPICKHGYTVAGSASITLERQGATLVFKDVPAQVCDNCGEAFHEAEVTQSLLTQAESTIAEGVAFDVRSFRRAA